MLKKINDLCESIEKIIIAYSILVMAIVAIVNVVGRNLFGTSFSWVEEVTQFSVVLVTFVGTAYAARNGLHIRMSALTDALPPKAKKFMAVIIATGTGLFMAYMTYYSVIYVKGLYTMNKFTLGLQIPVYFIILWVPLGFAMAALQYFATVWKNLKEEGIYISPTVLDGENEEVNVS